VSDTVGPHPSPRDLAAFDAGTLPAAARAEVEGHVATCADCCRTLDGLPDDDFVARMRALAGAPSADVPPELADHPRYRVEELLGAGGMGVVYRATHRLMGRTVALKVIHRRLSERPAFVDRFRHEVQAVARLAHANLVTAYDADRAGDVHFLVMEYVEGTALDRLVRRDGPLPAALACDVVRQAALGLHHAHERGLVHRDVKPSNILLTPAGAVKVLDFGLAQLAATEAPDEAPAGSAPLIGTPDYVAPEQARDPASAGARADVYGLGCTLYFLLTGQPPFPGGSVLQKLLAHQDRPPRPVTELRADVPPALATVLERMIAKDSIRRHPTAAAVADDLSRLAPAVPGRPRALRPVVILSAVPVALLAVLSLAVYLLRPAALGPGDADTSRPAPTEERPSALLEPPAPALVTAEESVRQKAAARDRAVDWLRGNNRWGPDHDLSAYLARKIDDDPDGLDGFRVTLGPGLVKSGRPTILAGRAGTLHVFELTPALARDLPIADKGCLVWTYSKSDDARRTVPRVALSDVTLEGGDALSPGRPWKGSVAYSLRERWAGQFALRLTFYPEGKRHTKLVYHDHLPESEQGSLPFCFPPWSTSHLITGGPHVVFIEVVTRQEGRMIVESNAAAAVAHVTLP
jgi:serine/threonine protein kinase